MKVREIVKNVEKLKSELKEFEKAIRIHARIAEKATDWEMKVQASGSAVACCLYREYLDKKLKLNQTLSIDYYDIYQARQMFNCDEGAVNIGEDTEKDED